MRARPLYFLIAREASTDSNDKMNSIIKVIDKFGVALDRELPGEGTLPIAVSIDFAIASLWLLDKPLSDATKITIEVSVVDPRGKKLGSVEQASEFPAGVSRISLNFNNQGLLVTGSGTYGLWARLSANGKKIAEADYPYEVRVEQQSKK